MCFSTAYWSCHLHVWHIQESVIIPFSVTIQKLREEKRTYIPVPYNMPVSSRMQIYLFCSTCISYSTQNVFRMLWDSVSDVWNSSWIMQNGTLNSDKSQTYYLVSPKFPWSSLSVSAQSFSALTFWYPSLIFSICFSLLSVLRSQLFWNTRKCISVLLFICKKLSEGTLMDGICRPDIVPKQYLPKEVIRGLCPKRQVSESPELMRGTAAALVALILMKVVPDSPLLASSSV